MQENIRKCFRVCEIRKTFLPWMIPVIQYIACIETLLKYISR